MKRKLGALAVVAAASLAAASVAGAAGAGQLCPTFKHRGKTYQVETLGTGWTCMSAETWIVKLSGDRVARNVTANIRLVNGPRRYHCVATPFSSGGRATAGMCIKGSIAYPKSGFAWTGS